MKKLISLLLVSILLVSLFACGKKKNESTTAALTTATTSSVDPIPQLPTNVEALALLFSASRPTKTAVTGQYAITVSSLSVTLHFSSTLTVDFSGYTPVARYDYHKEALVPLGNIEDSDGMISVIEGTVYSKDGHIKYEDSESVGPWTEYEGILAPNAFTFDPARLTAASISGSSFTATITKSNTEAVFGTAIAGDIALTITFSATEILSLTFATTLDSGANISFTATYTYLNETVQPPLETEPEND